MNLATAPLSERIDGHPEPQDLCVAAQPRAQFIELQMGEHKVAEGALMQRLGMGSRPHQPACDRGMSNTKDAFRRRDIQSFRQGTQHQGHTIRRRCEPIQLRVEARTEPAATRLTAPPLDSLGFSVAPIAHDGMDIRTADPIVLAGLIGTGEALGLHPFGLSWLLPSSVR